MCITMLLGARERGREGGDVLVQATRRKGPLQPYNALQHQSHPPATHITNTTLVVWANESRIREQRTGQVGSSVSECREDQMESE